MPTVTTKDGVEIFYKDWGRASRSSSATAGRSRRTIGTRRCSSSSAKGFRVIAHDRRGHGRSTQTGDGHDMDHYADDLAAVTAHLDLKDAIHVGHSTGGGEVVHYLARHGESRVAKAAIISAVPPLMVKTAANPGGLPKEVFDGLQAQLAANRASSTTTCRPARSTATTGPAPKPSRGGDLELVAPGHDGRCQGALRRHRRLLADRLHRGPEEDHGAGAGDARRRRPDRALRRLPGRCRPSC